MINTTLMQVESPIAVKRFVNNTLPSTTFFRIRHINNEHISKILLDYYQLHSVGKVMFSQACVILFKGDSVSSQNASLVRRGWVYCQRGVSGQGVGVWSGLGVWSERWPGWLQPWTVRVLLNCILVISVIRSIRNYSINIMVVLRQSS